MFSVTRLILLGLALLTVVNGRHAGNASRRPISDDEQECQGEFMGCAMGAMMIVGAFDSEEEFVNYLRETNIDDLCEVANGIHQCFADVVNDNKCTRYVPNQTRQIFDKASEGLNYVCVEKIDEIREHWDCLSDPQWEDDIKQCEPGPDITPNPISCDVSGPLACLHDVMDRDPQCKPGAKQLLDDVVNKILSEIPECNARTAFHRALKKAFMLKKK